MDIGIPNFKDQKFLKQHIIDTVNFLEEFEKESRFLDNNK
ncbi:hypothetical protein PB1_12869 [Bacillus methanolicus PB1]|uniref:Uncharacterized protein n=1 Tax=Bacillus methanolicus PB1 TaxID=997296 RepID=I3DW29_BACMT|nr:hypothetical protein PB1_12869 [Bacillus methanolicus PB1]